MPGIDQNPEACATPPVETMVAHDQAQLERRAVGQTRVFDADFAAQLEDKLNEADIPTVETPIVQIPEAYSTEHGQLSAQHSRKRTLRILLGVGAFAAAAFVSGLLSADKKPSAKVAPIEATTSTTNLPSTTTSSTPTTLQQFRPAATLESTTSSTQAPTTTTTAAANRMPINIDVQAIITDALESLQATTTTAARRPTTTATPSTTTSVPPVTTTRPAPTVTTQQSVPNSSFTPAR